jgi:phage/plasmid primase-like uncharacterized protein
LITDPIRNSQAPGDYRFEFRAAIENEVGSFEGDPTPDDRWHRFHVHADRSGERNLSVKMFADGLGGLFQYLRQHDKPVVWQAKRDKPLTPEERRAMRERVETARAEKAERDAADQARATARCRAMWDAARPADTHPYTEKKRCGLHGVRVGTYRTRINGQDVEIPGALFVPVRHGGKPPVNAIQAIFPNAENPFGRTKQFPPNIPKKGGYHPIGRPTPGGPIIFAEGYATAASIHEATGHPCVACFDRGNLRPVVEDFRARYPDRLFVVAADNDLWTRRQDGTPWNPGLESASKIANGDGETPAVPNVRVAVPVFADTSSHPTDFNDLAALESLARVAEIVNAALADNVPQPQDEAEPAREADAKPEVLLSPGSRGVVVDDLIIPHLRTCGDFFERGGELVTLASDGVLPMGVQALQMELDRRFDFFVPRKKGPAREDCPRAISEGVFHSRQRWGFSSLKARIINPTMDLTSGRVIERPGFDRETGLFLDFDGRWPGVPKTPILDDVRAAVNVLWRPFSEFPFRAALDVSVVFGLLLLAIVRQMLPTAPAVAVNAPTAGSGKTLLALCACRLAGAMFPTVLPGVDGDELRKRLLTIGRLSVLGAIFDNLVGRFGSDALCAWLTSQWFEDRLLGASTSIRVPTALLLVLTGNNLILVGDLCRRVLPAHLDPQCETPWRRAFAVDPLAHVEKHRLEMVAAGLTILRWALDRPRSFHDRTASFELWSDTVRHAVVEVGREGVMELPDPCGAIDNSYESDPDTLKLGALLVAWDSLGFDRPQTVAEILAACDRSPGLEDAVDEIAGERGQINRRRLGRWIEHREGRIVDGLHFRRAGTRQGVALWAVEKTHETPIPVGVVGDVGFISPTRAGKKSRDDTCTYITENTRGGLGSDKTHETPKTHGRDEAFI